MSQPVEGWRSESYALDLMGKTCPPYATNIWDIDAVVSLVILRERSGCGLPDHL